MEIKNKKILLVGLGISGRSAATFLLKQQAKVHGIDSNFKLLQQNLEIANLQQQGLTTSHDQESLDVKQFDYVVVSPGIPQTHPVYKQASAAKIEILGEVELACQFAKPKTFLAITGTNGKTTVTLLVAHVLNFNGIKAKALGNVGTPMTSEIGLQGASDEVVVAELSSFQLETMHSKIIDQAVLLNITPDHLDRYASMEHYALAKLQMIHCMKPTGRFYIEERCFKEFGHLIKNQNVLVYGYQPEAYACTDLSSLFLNGKKEFDLPPKYSHRASHDLENIIAAYLLCKSQGITPIQFFAALDCFRKPAHRIEFVATQNGIHYYDDSKGTNLDAVIRAVDSLQGPIVLIAGGVDKGAPYTPWISAFAGRVKQICAIGQAAYKIRNDIGHTIPVHLCQNLEEAVKCATKLAQKGDFVLLSPGCSSYDMFKDYAHRGEEFQRIVKNQPSRGLQ